MRFSIKWNLTSQIVLAMMLGITFGVLFKQVPHDQTVAGFIVKYTLEACEVVGQIFIIILKMLVVPVVLVSLIYGTCQINQGHKMTNMIFKTLTWYIVTTALAITLAIALSVLFQVGQHAGAASMATHFVAKKVPTIKETLLDMFPVNPFTALSEGKMLQIIFFSILFGVAMSASGKAGKRFSELFGHANTIIINLIHMIMKIAPLGVFCLITTVFASQGLSLIKQLAGYFAAVIAVLLLHWLCVYGGIFRVMTGLSPFVFFRKMYAAMLFAFSTSSSSASIPIVLDTAETKLGVSNSVASFVIPLGATINMDGTAIMQGVATVFISHVYQVPIGITGYLTVILMATLASIGTAGVPGVGLLTLAMVLEQVGLPVQGISLIIGIDRLLDMLRTAVNITGDCMVACVVAKSEDALSQEIFYTSEEEIEASHASEK